MSDLRLPPHNEEAEQSVLGSMMLDPDAVLVAFGQLTSSDFYRPAHSKIFDAIRRVGNEGNPVDQISVVDMLKSHDDLQSVGGAYYITEITEKVPSTANIKYYVTEVLEKSQLRTAIHGANEVMVSAYEGRVRPDNILSKLNKMASKIIRSVSGGYSKMEAISDEAMDTVIQRFEKPDIIPGLPTGIYEIDSIVGGLKGGDEIIIAARPSMGKTALALQIGNHVASNGDGVGVISLEMAKKQLYLRSLFQEARVPSDLLNFGAMSRDQFKELTRTSAEINKWPLYIDDASDGTASQIIAKAEHLCVSKNIKLLIFDYLQLMDEPGKENRNLEIGKITRMIKAKAKSLNIPIIVLSQLTKDADGRRPVLKDLRDSGSIEQDADVVIFIWRPEQNGIDVNEDGSMKGVAYIDVAKHRNGRTGDFKMAFIKEEVRFTQLFSRDDAPLPEPEQPEIF